MAGLRVFGERSPSGLWRRTGNAVRGNPSRVRIPPSPPPPAADRTPHACVGASGPRSRTFGCARCGPRRRLRLRRPSAAATARRPTPDIRRAVRDRRSSRSHGDVPVRGDEPCGRAGRRHRATWSATRPDPPLRHRLRVRRRRARRRLQAAHATGRRGPRRRRDRDRRRRRVVNCHLHVDHAGQNGAFAGVPILRPGGRMGGRHDAPTTRSSSGSTPPAPTTTRSTATTKSAPASGSSPRPVTPPATSRSSSTPTRRARSSSPARRSTRWRVDRRPGAREGRTRAGTGRLRPVGRAPARARPGARSGSLTTARPGRDPTGRADRPCYPSRAVLGGELAVPCSLQSAPAGLNPLSRSPLSVAARRCDVEDRVPRSDEPRTVSGPEGSSTKRSSSGAAERPGPSRPSRWARERVGRRRVHGITPIAARRPRPEEVA